MVPVPLYSITKPYIAAAALLSFEPELRLGSVVSGLPDALGRLVLRDVLSHRSGLDDYAAWPDYRAAVEAREEAWPAERVLGRLAVDRPRDPASPRAFSYSNAGYLLVRLALESHHGVGLQEVLTRLVLAPLGLDLGFFLHPGDWEGVSAPRLGERLRAYDPRWVYHGSLLGDPSEAARGIALMLGGALGEQPTRLMLHALPVHAPGHPLQPAGYGLGLMVGGSPTIAGHGGGGPGFELFAASTLSGDRWAGRARFVPEPGLAARAHDGAEPGRASDGARPGGEPGGSEPGRERDVTVEVLGLLRGP